MAATGIDRSLGCCWRVNHKRVERIWRREGLKVPKKQPPRRRLWLTDGSCIRLRAEHPNHVWAWTSQALTDTFKRVVAQREVQWALDAERRVSE